MLNVHVQMEVATAVRPSPRVLQTAAMFGLGVDEQRTMSIVPPLDLQLPFGDCGGCGGGGIVFITGPSGGGKSTMLALIAAAARDAGRRVIDLNELPPPEDAPLVELFDRPLQGTMELLSLVGLGDAFVMLRRPSELSDGQRARLRLAQAIELAERACPNQVHHGDHEEHGGKAVGGAEPEAGGGQEAAARAAGSESQHSSSSLRGLRDLRGEPSVGLDEGAIIIADEFAATLDRLTARNLAASLRRWVSRTRHGLVLATSHDDLLESLQPQVLIVKGLGEQVEVHETSTPGSRNVQTSQERPERRSRDGAKCNSPIRADRIVLDVSTFGCLDVSLEPATLRDYQSLARFHYRRGRPGVVTSGYKLVHRAATVVGRYLQRGDETQIVAVLLRSLPHLGCSLRDLAARGRYRGLSRREAAKMLNREVHTISRVIVDPRFRGLGLAAALVRHALRHPERGIMLTEALATMGQVHPFFEKAGMTRYQRPPRPPHARLGDALAQLMIPLETLASLRAMRAAMAALDETRQAWLQDELRRFAQATRGRGGGSRRRADDLSSFDDLVRHAREHLLNQPVYYAFVHSSPSRSEGEGPRKRGEGAFDDRDRDGAAKSGASPPQPPPSEGGGVSKPTTGEPARSTVHPIISTCRPFDCSTFECSP